MKKIVLVLMFLVFALGCKPSPDFYGKPTDKEKIENIEKVSKHGSHGYFFVISDPSLPTFSTYSLNVGPGKVKIFVDVPAGQKMWAIQGSGSDAGGNHRDSLELHLHSIDDLKP